MRTPIRRTLTSPELIGLLWLLGVLLPLATLGWLLVDPPAGVPDPPTGVRSDFAPGPWLVVHLLVFVPMAFVGASLALRPKPLPVAGLMLVVGACNGVALFARVYAAHALVDPGSLPAADAAAWLSGLDVIPHTLVAALGLAMLRTGRLPSPWPWWVAVPPLVVGAARITTGLFEGGPLDGFPYVDNPLALPGALTAVPDVADHPLAWLVALTLVAVWLAGQARREPSPGVRGVLWRVSAMTIAIPGALLLFAAAGAEDQRWIVTVGYTAIVLDVTVFTARRERLWGTSVLVHRTAVWAVLSVIAAAIAAGGLLLLARIGHGGGIEQAAAVALGIAVAAAAHAWMDAALRRRLVGEGAESLQALTRLQRRLLDGPARASAAQVLADAAVAAAPGSSAAVDVLVAGGRRRAAGRVTAGGTRASVPLVHAGQAVGVLVVSVPERMVLGDAERRLLDELATAAAPAIDAERLASELGAGRRLGDTAADLDREQVARLLDDRVVAPLDRLAADLAAGRPAGEAYAAAAEMIEEVRTLAHDLAARSDAVAGAGAR